MRLSKLLLFSATMVLALPATSQNAPQNAASSLAASAPTAVPPLVPYSGTVATVAGRPLPSNESVSFLIYSDEQGGEPLFSETQSVAVDSTGHFKAQIGATLTSGLPIDLFASGEARWLAVQIAGEPAQPRVLLASVPYALKAADAATLGGLPASAFALAGTKTFTPAALTPDVTPTSGTPVTATGGFAGYLPVFNSSSSLVNSTVYQNSNGIGINGIPYAALDVTGRTIFRGIMVVSRAGNATATTGYGSVPLQFFANGWNSTINGPVQPVMQWQAEVTGNNTASPGATLNLLYNNGTVANAVETGLYFNPNGTIHFAPGQAFPGGGGGGTITGVTAGTALTGGGTTGNVTLNLDTTKVPQLGTANVFVGNQSVTGSVTANDSSAANLSSGIVGNESAATGEVFGVIGTTASSGTYAAGVNGYENAKTGLVFGVSGQTSSVTDSAAGGAFSEMSTTGRVFGVSGLTNSTGNGASGVTGNEGAATGVVFGVGGYAVSTTSGAAGVNGSESAKTGLVYGVLGTANSSTFDAAGVQGVQNATTGQVYGVNGTSASSGANSAGVGGYAMATTGSVAGAIGYAVSTTDGASGIEGYEGAVTGAVYGASGGTGSTTNGAAGVYGEENALTGQVFGVSGTTWNSTTAGAAGVYGLENALTGRVFGVSGNTSSAGFGSAAVYGYEGAATGQVFGVFGALSSSTNGAAGVSGNANATTGQVYGVNGSTGSSSSGAAGVNGYEGATTGAVWGVQGATNSPDGAGVFGSDNSTTGGNGVQGLMNATSGFGAGVQGATMSPEGNGVVGTNNSGAGGTGVAGFALTTTGFGVQGHGGPNGVGVQGNSPNVGVAGFSQSCDSSTCTPTAGTAGLFVTGTGGTILQGNSGSGSSSTTTEVFYVDSSGNGYFAGNLSVTGKVSKGSGSFKIDDPLDPANKYLSHSFVESPDMMNVYNGNITTDKHGMATVELPQYFESLNSDFRYQLTVMGQFAQAIVATKIGHNRFVIRTNKPAVEVSWQVTGIRKDAYANANRIPTEEDKPADERGYYLHPEVFGEPASKSVVAAHTKPSGPATLAQLAAGSR